MNDLLFLEKWLGCLRYSQEFHTFKPINMASENYTPSPAKFNAFLQIMDQIRGQMYKHNLIQYYCALRTHVSKNKSYHLEIPSPHTEYLNAHSLSTLSGLSWKKADQLIQAYRQQDPTLIHCRYHQQFQEDLCVLRNLVGELIIETLRPDQIPDGVNSVELRKVMPTEEEQMQALLALFKNDTILSIFTP